MLCPPHPPCFDHTMLVRNMILEASHYAVFFSLPYFIFGPNVFFKTLFLGHPQLMFLPYCMRSSCLQLAELSVYYNRYSLRKWRERWF
jgi:hypothetical protein